MHKTLSPYKFKRIASESLRNSLRLHADSMLLYVHASYPSAYLLSVLALEELAKCEAVAHYYYTSITNDGFPEADFEQEWLSLLYSHIWKQNHFLAKDLFKYSPKLIKLIQSKQFEAKKHRATYVGLERLAKKVDVNAKISVPACVKEKDARQLISLLNLEYLQIHDTVQNHGQYFGVNEADIIINPDEHQFIFSWPHKSSLKSRRYVKLNTK